LKRSLRTLPHKVWERVSGIESRRIRLDLSNTQSELTNTQSELTNTQSELTNTQSELTNTQSELRASRTVLNEFSGEVIQLVGRVDEITSKNPADVTVIVTTKNRPNLLLRALTSINRQSQLPLGVAIINNGEKFSPEEEARIRSTCSAVARIRMIDAQNLLDISSCRQLGLQNVSTKFAAYLDDDNIMWPRWIENAFEFMSERDVSFIYGAQLREDSDPSYFHQEFSKDKIREQNFVDTNSMMHKSDFGRWTPGVTRLSDWNFVLNYLSDHPDSLITPVSAISTLYKVDAPDRLSSSLYSPYRILIGLLHGLIPDGKQILAKKFRYCVVCDSSNSFSAGPNGRKYATCSECGSIERYRALKIINEVLRDYLVRKEVQGKVIEVAPSNVSRSIFEPFGDNYLNFDANPSADGRECDFIADICETPFKDNSVSEFVALHVLEHVPNDKVAMKEICRVMAPNGICILQVPLAENTDRTDEEVIIDDEIRAKRYGQSDHVRLYGTDIVERLEASGLIGRLLSMDDMLPKFLVDILGLDDGFKFIICTPNFDSSAAANLEKVIEVLTGELLKLEIFCRLFEELDSD
jgi:SAM-dependent methyltransferase